MPAPAEAPPPAFNVAKMSKVQKLAALLIVLGPETAAELLKHLEEAEIEDIAAEMVKLPSIPHEVQEEILKEFTTVAVQANNSILGGINFIESALEKSIGVFRATNVLSRVAPARPPLAAVRQITQMEPAQLYNLIKDEQPQAIALVLSHLPAEKGARLLVLLKQEIRDAVVERLATMAPTPVEVVEKLADVLAQKAGTRRTRALNQTGGVKSAADLLNALDKNSSKALLVAIDERNAELGNSIRARMFTFEDLGAIDPAGLQKVLRDVDMRDLAVALKSASERVRKALLSCISKRAAESVKEEMEFMASVKAKEVEAAQQRIIEVVRRLESEGELEIDHGKRDDGKA
jgi:flagellar motor switch protein FliG